LDINLTNVVVAYVPVRAVIALTQCETWQLIGWKVQFCLVEDTVWAPGTPGSFAQREEVRLDQGGDFSITCRQVLQKGPCRWVQWRTALYTRSCQIKQGKEDKVPRGISFWSEAGNIGVPYVQRHRTLTDEAAFHSLQLEEAACVSSQVPCDSRNLGICAYVATALGA